MSTSGREEHGGVFVVFSDGTVALDSFYSNGKQGKALGPEGSRAEATACHQGILAVVSIDEEQKRGLDIYGLKVALISLTSEACSDVINTSLILDDISPKLYLNFLAKDQQRQGADQLWTPDSVCGYWATQHSFESWYSKISARSGRGSSSWFVSLWKSWFKVQNSKTRHVLLNFELLCMCRVWLLHCLDTSKYICQNMPPCPACQCGENPCHFSVQKALFSLILWSRAQKESLFPTFKFHEG